MKWIEENLTAIILGLFWLLLVSFLGGFFEKGFPSGKTSITIDCEKNYYSKYCDDYTQQWDAAGRSVNP